MAEVNYVDRSSLPDDFFEIWELLGYFERRQYLIDLLGKAEVALFFPDLLKALTDDLVEAHRSLERLEALNDFQLDVALKRRDGSLSSLSKITEYVEGNLLPIDIPREPDTFYASVNNYLDSAYLLHGSHILLIQE